MYFSALVYRLPFHCNSSSWSVNFRRLYGHVPKLTEWNPQPLLTQDMMQDFEKMWKKHVDSVSFPENSERPYTYILSMFPYPSGKLHMGHVRVYTISDTLARFYRMLGHNVLHPMGWDAFGLPAENAAIQSGQDPALWTENNIKIMRTQLKQLGCSFDWQREFATCQPHYYKWTQYIFIKMYEAGLIYRKPSLVNWDPVDKTVLADEQIDENGHSWRSGAKAEKKLLTQWFVRSTKFSSSLIKELANFEKLDWADVINLQKSWIGELNGVTFDWKFEGMNHSLSIPIWTQNPTHVCKAEFIAVRPGSLLDILQEKKSSFQYNYFTSDGEEAKFTVSPLDFLAFNPFTQDKVPVYVVDGYLPFAPGSDSYMGVPSEMDIDHQFTKFVQLETKTFSLQDEDTCAESLCKKAQELGVGGYQTSSHLKDWLISRQRYWGTPIPMVHCSDCGTVPVAEDQLPVHLPDYPSIRANPGIAISPLALAEEWKNTSCPKCGGPAIRETDTMDTFVDSSWYYLRFLDPFNEKELVGLDKAKKYMPVNVYIGGKEHATLHLYYARVVSHFLHQIGITTCPEPFHRLLVQGMVMGQTFLEKESGRYLQRSEVKFHGEQAVSRVSGQPVIVKWDKMSKSKHNGVDPADAISSFGIDSTRLFMLADAAPFSQRNWDPNGSKGVTNWLNNLYMLVSRFISLRRDSVAGKLKVDPASIEFREGEDQIRELRNRHLSAITHSYKNTHQFMVAIKSMQTLTKQMKKFTPEVMAFGPRYEMAMAMLIATAAPMAPHFASELWRGFLIAPGRLNSNAKEIDWDKPVLQQPWPSLDTDYKLPFTVLVNFQEVCITELPYGRMRSLNNKDIIDIALGHDKVRGILGTRSYFVHEASLIEERGARVLISVPGLKVREEDTISSFTKKGRQARSKQGKQKEEEAAL